MNAYCSFISLAGTSLKKKIFFFLRRWWERGGSCRCAVAGINPTIINCFFPFHLWYRREVHLHWDIQCWQCRWDIVGERCGGWSAAEKHGWLVECQVSIYTFTYLLTCVCVCACVCMCVCACVCVHNVYQHYVLASMFSVCMSACVSMCKCIIALLCQSFLNSMKNPVSFNVL